MYVYEVHAHEMHACKVHAYEMHAYAEQDLQYHRAKSLTSTLLGTGQFFCRHPEAGTPLLDMKLRGSGQRSGKKES
jgi:hypothetical protein